MKLSSQNDAIKARQRKPVPPASKRSASGAAHADLPDLPLQLSAPAKRALAREGLTTLSALTQMTETELMALHGVGPNAVKTLESALRQKGLTLSSRR
jgi:DNA-directed RNA polymerase alpha subunit